MVAVIELLADEEKEAEENSDSLLETEGLGGGGVEEEGGGVEEEGGGDNFEETGGGKPEDGELEGYDVDGNDGFDEGCDWDE